MGEILKQLQLIFNELNKGIFKNNLPKTIISITPKRSKNGDFSKKTIWINDKDEYYDICLSPRVLKFQFEDIVLELLTQMIHLHNNLHKIKDMLKGEITEEYLKSCEKLGIELDEEDNIVINDKVEEILDNSIIDRNVFKLHLKDKKKGKMFPSTVTYKYECPKCKRQIRTKESEFIIRCVDCDEEMLKQD